MPRLSLARWLVALAALVALVALPRAARATPSQELGAARTSFRAGKFPEAIATLSGLLYPQSRLSDPGELAEAHLLLGVAYFETGRRDSATRELDSALFLDRSLDIEAGLFSDEAVAFFQAHRRTFEGRARADLERARAARERDAIARAMQSAVVLEKQSYLANFIPFGAGQFQNGHTRKGVGFAVAEAVLGGASFGAFTYQVLSYGIGGEVPRDEVEGVRTIQVIQVSTGVAFFAVYVWGVIDSLANYQHTVQRDLDPATKRQLEDILRKKDVGDKAPDARLLPIIGPDQVGAALSWEF